MFPFGPKLPGMQQLFGLPSTLPKGGMTFSMGFSKDLQLRIDGVTCALRDNYKKCGSDVLWLDSWYFGRLLSSLLISPRQVLDIGCGLGLTSVTAAKLGHNVTSTDVDPAALQATKQNAARNGVNLTVETWNFSLPFSESVQQSGPFDIGVFSAGMGIFSLPRGANPRRLDDLRERVCLKLAMMLAKLPVKAFYLKCKGTPKGRRLQPCLSCGAFLKAARHLGRKMQVPCRWEWQKRHLAPWTAPPVGLDFSKGRCDRGVLVSPHGWIEEWGLGPATEDRIIVW